MILKLWSISANVTEHVEDNGLLDAMQNSPFRNCIDATLEVHFQDRVSVDCQFEVLDLRDHLDVVFDILPGK